MYQDYDDGIIMDNTLLIVDEKKTGFPVTTRLFQFLVIAIGSWSGLSMLIQTIGIPCNTIQINGAILAFTTLFYIFCLHSPYGLVKLFFSTLCYGLFFYSRLSAILNGFYIAENLVLQRISAYYGSELLIFKADYSTAKADITLLLIMILFPVIGLLSLAVVRNVLVSFVGIIMFLPVSACFALGLIPSEVYLIAYAVSLLYLTRSGYNYYHSTERQQKTLLHRISSRSAVWLSLLSLFMFFLIKLFVSKEEYDNLGQIKEIKVEIQSAMNDFSIEEFSGRITDIKLFPRKGTSTGLNGGELGKTGQVKFQNTKHLVITAPIGSIDEGIYLKGYVGSVYTGDRWDKHSQKMQEEYDSLLQRMPQELFSPVNQMNTFLDQFIVNEGEEIVPPAEESSWYVYSMNQGRMKVEYKGANKKYLYAPYFTDYSALSNILYEEDLYAAPTIREDNYEIPYYYNVFLLNNPTFYENLLEKLKDYTEYEKLYRDYVHRVYTILPEDGLLNIKRDFAPGRVKTKSGSITEKIEYVKNYLHQNTQYSLTPGKLPEGEDFVEYFVYENKVGYCAHYASAATLMLRTLGIPARYIEGYAVGSEAIYRSAGSQETIRYTNTSTNSNIGTQSEVNVMDYNAHAWVEVYFDNCGWVPVEFTPGSIVDYNDSVVADMEEFSDNIENGNILNNLEETSTQQTPEPEIPELQQPVNEEHSDMDQARASQSFGRSDHIFLLIVLGGLLLALLLFLIYRMNKIQKARYSRNYNKRAIFCYSEIQKMIRTSNGLPGKTALLEESEAYVKEHFIYIEENELEELMEVARKARFSQGWISEEELNQLLNFRKLLYLELMKNLPLPKKVYLKFILLI
jgi:transglutaminase-like putative cysteine protease